ncbi:MAG: DUF1552 domain-containing protein [Myxococcota bacterium]
MTQRYSRHGFSRRRLLQSLGLGAAMGPLLPLLNASGQEMVFPKRLILIFTPDGMAAKDYNTAVDWRPTGTEADFTLHAIHAPLEPFKSKIVVPWGLTMTAGGAGEAHAYGMAGLWSAATLHTPGAGADFDGGNGNRTGWGSGPTVDQIVAQASGTNCPYQKTPTDAMQETPYRSVALGVQCGQPTSVNRMTYSGDNQPIHPEVNSKAAFDRLFKGVTPSGSTPMEDPAAVQARAEQQALLNVLKHDLGRIRTRVGAEEYKKIDQHLTGLSAIERRIADSVPRPPTSGCTLPSAPMSLTSNNANYPAQITQMMDIAAHALACDVTRVLTLQLSYGFSNVTHTWLGHTSAHHTMSHDGNDRRSELQAIDNWYMKQIAYFAQQLDSVQEGNGTLLDNCLIVCGRELGTTAHRMERVPFVMIGKARGALRTQRFMNFDKQDHAKLLVSIAQLMGVSITSIGDRKPNSGALSGLV